MPSQEQGPHWFERRSGLWAISALFIIAGIGVHVWSRLDRWQWDGSDWQAVWTLLASLVAAIAASAALAQLKQHRKAQADMSRPYTIVDFAFRGHLVMLEVKNIGKTPALDVKLTWNEPPVALDEGRTAALRRHLVEGTIPYLAPGRSIRYFVGSAPDYLSNKELPRRFEVEARYVDVGGEEHGVGETLVLDLDQWSEALADTDYENKNWKELKRQAGALEEVSKSLKRIDATLSAIQDSASIAHAFLRRAAFPTNDLVNWTFTPGPAGVRWLWNIGSTTAEDVVIEDVSDALDRSPFHVRKNDIPSKVAPFEAVMVFVNHTLGSARDATIRIGWKEGQIAREVVLKIW